MLINGQIADQLPGSDRGLAYGDGLFETIRVHDKQPLFLPEHLERLQHGCKVLGLAADLKQINGWINQAIVSESTSDFIVKLILTRGSGGRGYRPPEAAEEKCLISIHPLPDYSQNNPAHGVKAFLCKQRLAHQPVLAGLKHLNRLEQVLASREFPDSSYMEGLMLDYRNQLIEGTRTNVFIAKDGKLLTPALDNCGIVGVMRRKLLEHFSDRALVSDISLEMLMGAEEVFVVNSVAGIWPVTELAVNGRIQEFPFGPFAKNAQRYFSGVLQ